MTRVLTAVSEGITTLNPHPTRSTWIKLAAQPGTTRFWANPQAGVQRPSPPGRWITERRYRARCTMVLMDSDRSHRAVNLADKLSQFDDHWSPRTLAEFNGHDVMVVKIKGEFVWHHHDNTDDFFLVLTGRITIRMREGNVELGPGELLLSPWVSSTSPLLPRKPSCCSSSPAGRQILEMKRPQPDGSQSDRQAVPNVPHPLASA